MPITAEKVNRMKEYTGIQTITTDHGYIAWQVSTGENVEILFIEVDEPGNGYGTELVRLMCERIKPYNSVFVFRRGFNIAAGRFYRKLGFTETNVHGVYKGEMAVIGTISYETLCQNVSR